MINDQIDFSPIRQFTIKEPTLKNPWVLDLTESTEDMEWHSATAQVLVAGVWSSHPIVILYRTVAADQRSKPLEVGDLYQRVYSRLFYAVWQKIKAEDSVLRTIDWIEVTQERATEGSNSKQRQHYFHRQQNLAGYAPTLEHIRSALLLDTCAAYGRIQETRQTLLEDKAHLRPEWSRLLYQQFPPPNRDFPVLSLATSQRTTLWRF